MLTKNAIKVLERRYLVKDEEGNIIETPDQMFMRIAKAIARADMNYGATPQEAVYTQEKFYDLMRNLVFLPNSPTLMNADRDLGQLSACFVLPIEDSMEGIFDSVKSAALIHKSGGGTGFSFSRLRAKGSRVKATGGVASGPVSFMKVFNAATEAVKQGGTRRGANMAILRVDHPDIIEFITCKEDITQITNFNISVAITKKFMDAVYAGEKYDLIDPHTKLPVGQLDANEVFDLIVHMAWLNGEPGIVFIDRMNDANMVPNLGDIESTNPCVTGDTWILTRDGYHRIDTLIGKEVDVWNGEEFSTVTPRITGENQKILLVKFSDGSEVKCTPYHSFYIEKSKDLRKPKSVKLEARDLEPGMKLEKFKYPVIEGNASIYKKLAYTMGVFAGDGSNETNRERSYIWLYGDKKALLYYLSYESMNECDNDRLFVKLKASDAPWDKNFVPSGLWDTQSRLDWLAGLIDTDGNVQSNGSVCIWSSNYDFLKKVKLLIHTLGVGCTLALGKPADLKLMPDGHGGEEYYECKDQYRISISGYNIAQLRELGLETHRVDISYIPERDASRFITIESIEDADVAFNVYCFTENKRHRGMFGSVVLGNCGEQPLLSYESCNLGSINLTKVLKTEPVDDESVHYVIDWDYFKSVVWNAVHFLDNVIDVNKYPLPQIEEQSKATRKIGLGVMGWADMLIMLGIPYNSEKAIDLANELMGFIDYESKQASMGLAKKRGAFPAYKGSKWDIEIRNAATTTVAPTGTISIIAGVSSGIEPLFALAFFKNVMDNDTLPEANDMFKKTMEANSLYSPSIMAKVAEHGTCAGIKKIPKQIRDLYVTAHDITPDWHVKMQSAFQKHVDSAVSKTINFGSDATEGDVKDAYLMADQARCKGITVYRDGSRTGQVLNVGTKKEEPKVGLFEAESIQLLHSRPRTGVVQGITEKVKIGCGNLFITVNYDDQGICEVFTQVGKGGGCPSQSEAAARLVSVSLRAGLDPKEVIEQLKGIRCHSTIRRKVTDKEIQCLSCPDAIAKTIEKAIKIASEKTGTVIVEDTTTVEENTAKCPECGSKITHQDGCVICHSCGYSKCG